MAAAKAALVVTLVAACNGNLLATSQILDVDSTQGIDPTGNFAVNGAWELKYSWDCARQASEQVADINRFGLIVYNSDDDSTDYEHPELHLKGPRGGATLRFSRGGEFYVSVDSPCDWRLQVVDLAQSA